MMNLEKQIRHLIRDEVEDAVRHAVDSLRPQPDRPDPRTELSGRLLTTDEVAEQLRMKPATVRRMADRGEIRHTKIGRKYLISTDELARVLDSNAERNTEPAEVDDREVQGKAVQILAKLTAKQGKAG